MAILPSAHTGVPSCCFCIHGLFRERKSRIDCYGIIIGKSKCRCCSYETRAPFGSRTLSRTGLISVRGSKLCATDIRFAENNGHNSNAPTTTARTSVVEIPVTCYQILGVSDQAEKDEIVKSAMHLKNAEIEEGYTMDAVVSRQNLLMDVRDKLLFEPEYAGNVKEKVPPRSSLRIPWAWLPGALCLLQEVGEEKLVLDIGRKALQNSDAKPYIHDLLLSMALSECAIAKAGFEKNNISLGFEALARAQCLLRSKISLGKMTLLSQIEESLEELAPACTLELLGMPRSPENAERRLGAIAALRELLRQGLDVESSCQVHDWPCFLSQALNKLLATEIVELLRWDNLALTRKNKKSLESQNQRVIIDLNCFYIVLIAHIALGFSSKQTGLINKAKTICECLIASEGIDLKLEEAFCLFLLGQGDEAMAAEKLRQLDANSNPSLRGSTSGKEIRDVSSANQSLETWLKDSVLNVFPDTRDCSPSMASFFAGEKRALGNRKTKRSPMAAPGINHRSISPVIPSDQRGFEEPGSLMDSSRHLGAAVKQLAPSKFEGPSILIANKTAGGESDVGSQHVQLKRSLGTTHHNNVWELWLGQNNVVVKIILATSLGCILFATIKLMSMHLVWNTNKSKLSTNSITWTTGSSRVEDYSNSIGGRLKKLFFILKKQIRNRPEAEDMHKSFAASLASSMPTVHKRTMPVEEAEALVKRWQAIKSEALGPNYQLHCLFEILDETMLNQWQALAESAKARSCFWRFVLLQLCVLRADIVSDGNGEIAEIEALLEEAAELVDDPLQKNPSYYSAYKVLYSLKRHADGSWRFCEVDIQTPS